MENNFRNTNLNNIENATVITQKNLLASVFAWMFAGMVITTIASFLFAYVPNLYDLMVTQGEDGFYHRSILGHIIAFAPLLILIGMGVGYKKLPFIGIASLFLFFSAVLGVSISFIFYRYQVESIVTIFLSTCALFGTMAFVGYFTKTDLTKLGSILWIGVIGVFFASLINYFFHSQLFSYIISFVSVIVFTGMTAYDMQKIKNTIAQNDGSESFKKYTVIAALELYLDFINIFMSLLNLFGKRN